MSRLLRKRPSNALAESVIGLYKTEVIRHGGQWRGFDDDALDLILWEALGGVSAWPDHDLFAEIP